MSNEESLETGSYSEFGHFSASSEAEAIMRGWQISEALARMAKRIKTRYPKESRILKRASEEVCFEFFKSFQEAQDHSNRNIKENHAKDLLRQKEARENKIAADKIMAERTLEPGID